MTNLERQHLFRKRHPDYNRAHNARRRALAKAVREQYYGTAAATVVEEAAKPPLMLPAPAEELRIAGVNAIPTRAEFESMRSMVADAAFTEPPLD